MSRFSARIVAASVLLVGSLGGCAKPDANAAGSSPAPATATVSSGGEVAAAKATSGLGGGSSDTASNAADRGRIRGAEGAQVWLVEVSDFQCPFCKRWHDEVYPTIDREYVQTGKVRMAYINYPLSSIHPNARAASEAAMCASVQGKFWELHTSLFQTQPAWAAMPDPMKSFDSLAVAAQVDPAAWRRCMTTHATAALIDADRERASKSGVSSTPSFFVGNRGLIGSYPVDTFRVVLDSAIARARAGR
jgi:protein-disulfide isomerase